MIKILNLKLVILLEYQNIKTFLQKAMFQISLKKFFLLKVKIAVLWTSVISDLKNEKKLSEHFTKKELQKTNQKELYRVEKIMQRKGDKLYVKWKGTIVF